MTEEQLINHHYTDKTGRQRDPNVTSAASQPALRAWELAVVQKWFNRPVGRWGEQDGFWGMLATQEGYQRFNESGTEGGVFEVLQGGVYSLSWVQQVRTNVEQLVIYTLTGATNTITRFQTLYPGWSELAIRSTMAIGTPGGNPGKIEIRIENPEPILLAGYSRFEIYELT